VNGFIFVDKPAGPSSFAIVKRIRRDCGVAKAGHCGTLDPLASGLLICAVGTATRLIPEMPSEPKRYTCTVQFGCETDTLDAEGQIVCEGGSIPQPDALREALTRFTGQIEQAPPRYSAVKIQGKRAYALARSNQSFAMPVRSVTVSELSLASYTPQTGEASLRIVCSKGTYIRSLARDLARALGTCGYAAAIRRTGIGLFSVDQALSPEECSRNPRGALRSVHTVFSDSPSARITNEQKQAIAYGKPIALDGRDQPRLMLFDDDGECVAVAKRQGEALYHPVKVLVKA
jgi:tRNA pseudouridine55 synthase